VEGRGGGKGRGRRRSPSYRYSSFLGEYSDNDNDYYHHHYYYYYYYYYDYYHYRGLKKRKQKGRRERGSSNLLPTLPYPLTCISSASRVRCLDTQKSMAGLLSTRPVRLPPGCVVIHRGGQQKGRGKNQISWWCCDITLVMVLPLLTSLMHRWKKVSS